jgi:hypothetical protein
VNQLAIALLVLILVGGLGWWFYNNFERVEYTVHTEMSPEARRNPLLAAERLLKEQGQQVESQSGRHYLVNPPLEQGAMLVRDLRTPLSQHRVDNLLEWVATGGHLIVSPSKLLEAETNRPLLESFGVSLVGTNLFSDVEWLQEVFEEAEKKAKQQGQHQDQEEEMLTTEVLLPGDELPLWIDFDKDRWFEVDSEHEYWLAPADEDPHILVFPYGQGYVTFLSDSNIFRNRRLGEHEHASLLAELTAGYDQVWLLYSAQMPSLLQIIWRWAPYLVLSLLLFVALLLWRMSRRSGPLIVRGQQQRRDLLEHLGAAAEYNWRFDPKAGYLQRAREQVEKRWLASHPQLHRLDQAARCQWLAEHTGITPEAISLALYDDQKDAGSLVKITANLQRLLSALHPQSKKR